MPPKRAPKPPVALVSTRASRSRTKTGATENTEASPAGTGKRKRTDAATMDNPAPDAEEAPQAKSKAKTVLKKSKIATKNPRTAVPKKVGVPFAKKTCEKWFETLEDIDSPGNITHNTIPKWLEDLNVSPEGIVFYLIAWKCKAKHTFTITREEFLVGMTVLSVDSNESLLRKLPMLLKETIPSFTNRLFDSFYKFCFTYFKPNDVKNLSWDVASELLTSLLDSARYSLIWCPPSDGVPDGVQEVGGKGEFPHRRAFVEFLNQEPRPVQVITRDQYDQFLPFNRDVPWNLEGFKEEESTWPTLMDVYITWRKDKSK